MTEVEQKFRDIARRASDDAAVVPCSQREYRDGLKLIILSLTAEWEASIDIDRHGSRKVEPHPREGM